MIGSDYATITDARYLAPALQAAAGGQPAPRPEAVDASNEERIHAGASDEVVLFRKPRERPEIPIEAGQTADEHNAAQGEATGAGIDRELTVEERQQVDDLKKRDEEVRRHEEAHFRAGGRYASSPHYEYQTGPDGKRYAVGGSVDIDTSAVPDNPRATLEKARIIKRAALAPEEPSNQDRKVAREADQMATEAMRAVAAAPSAAPAAAPDAAPHRADRATTSEAAPAETTEPASRLDIEVGATQQSLIRYKTSRLQYFHVPVSSRLNEDTQRIPLLRLFDRYA
ncbi:MAG: putative metalloprotease CJM1_0395 family protein [Rhodothermales bacterium]|nr:putative metalloprotease CJM1_0395 family protein [Rhodothermales bacterium]